MSEKTPHILVVDDNAEIRDLLSKYLVRNGLRAATAASGAEARKVLSSAAIDLIVLDIMMPGEDGLSVCRYVRETMETPVILLTAVAEDTDRIIGLEMGADDYLTKPFNPRELLARIKAVLRRANSLPHGTATEATEEAIVRFGDWRLRTDRRELEDSGGKVISLSTAEFALIKAFTDHPRMVLSRDQLLDLTQGRAANVFDRSIDNQVSRLRKKIEPDPKNPTLIKTVWGGGYMLSAAVERGAKAR
ncbi:response regulator [Oleispirillum naphthae]|uniref:response regulator n=1 Tax=Oleispirillum naphthae TaxID=2838853 RepID=UPI0030825598